MQTSTRRIAAIALCILALDQLTKYTVIYFLETDHQVTVLEGFFKIVHWGNTGAAWSLFLDKNGMLAAIAVVALVVLFRARHHFEAHTTLGQVALGLIFGGIIGNLADRLILGRVTDFLYFYLERRGADPIGFPAFNVADSAICIGVGLIFIATLKNEKTTPNAAALPPDSPISAGK